MNVLIAHAGESSRRGLMKALAGEGRSCLEFGDGKACVEALLADDAPRLAIIDWDLPDIDGPEVCRLVRDFHLEAPPYVILLAGAAHHGEVAAGLEAGANDCIRTPIGGGELRERVETGRRFVGLPGGRPATPKRSRGPTFQDEFVGVRGSEDILARLDEELARARRERGVLSIGVLEVRGLAAVRVSGGDEAVERVLHEVDRRARLRMRSYDRIGRLGSGKFLILIPGVGEPDASAVLERFRDVVNGAPFRYGDLEAKLTVSVGGATGSEESSEELVAAAEQDLAEAEGKGSVAAGHKVELEAVLSRE